MSDIFTPTRPCDKCRGKLDPGHDCIASLLERVPEWLHMKAYDLPNFVTVLLCLEDGTVGEGYRSPKGWVMPRIFGFVKPLRFMRMPEPWRKTA